MADNILKAIITADGSQFEKGIESIKGSMQSLGGDFSKISQTIDNFAKSGKLSIGVIENAMIELKSVIKQTTNPADLQRLNDAFTQLQAKLNALKLEGGLTQQLGGVSRATRLAHSDLDQLALSLRGFASGGLSATDALSNLVFTFERLEGVSGGIEEAFTAIGGALLSPAGIILAVTALVPLLVELGGKFFGAGEEAKEFEKKVDELKKSLDKLKEPINITIATASGSIGGEITKLKTLVSQATNQQIISGTETVESINRRKTALIELQKLYKDEFNNITFVADASNKLAIAQAGQAAENVINRKAGAEAVSKEVSDAQTLVNVTQANIDNLKTEHEEKLKSLGTTDEQIKLEQKRRAELQRAAATAAAPIVLPDIVGEDEVITFQKRMKELVKIRDDAGKELGKKQVAETDIVVKQVGQGDFKESITKTTTEALAEQQRILIRFAEEANKVFVIKPELQINDLDTQAEKLRKAIKIQEGITNFTIKLKLPDTEKIDKVDLKNVPVEIQDFEIKGADKFKTELEKALEKGIIEIRTTTQVEQSDQQDLKNVPGKEEEKQLEDLTNEFAKFGDAGVRAWSKITSANANNTDRIKAGKEQLKELAIQEGVAAAGALALGDAVASAFDAIVAGKDPVKAFFDSFIKSIEQLIAKLIAAAVAAEVLNLATGGTFGGATGFLGIFGKLLGFAEGGSTPSDKPYWVGEKGKELFFPGTSGMILSNQKSKALLSESVAQSKENKSAVYAHKFTTIINNIDNSVRKWVYGTSGVSTFESISSSSNNSSIDNVSSSNLFAEKIFSHVSKTLADKLISHDRFTSSTDSQKLSQLSSQSTSIEKLISVFNNLSNKTNESSNNTIIKIVDKLISSLNNSSDKSNQSSQTTIFDKTNSSDSEKLISLFNTSSNIFKEINSRIFGDSTDSNKATEKIILSFNDKNSSTDSSNSAYKVLDKITSSLQNNSSTEKPSDSSIDKQSQSSSIEKLISTFSYRSTGGEVTHDKPFIVGEKRAELFVPKTDGFIIPFVQNRRFDESLVSTLNVNKTIIPRAAGGSASAGSQFLVGEFGPEAFFPKTSSTNPQSNGIISGQSQSIFIPKLVIEGNNLAIFFNQMIRNSIATTGKKPF